MSRSRRGCSRGACSISPRRRLVLRVGKQRGLAGQRVFKPVRRNRTAIASRDGLAGGGNGRCARRDAAFAVRHGAGPSPQVLAGSRRSAQASGGGCEGVLHHHELGALRAGAPGLRHLCAGLVQAIHSLISPPAGLEHFHGGLAGHLRHARRHSAATRRGAGLRSGGRETGGQAADLAPAHGVGLAGEREGPAPGLPICPVARCRCDQGGVLGVPLLLCSGALAPQAERGRAGRPVPPPDQNQRVAVTMSCASMPHLAAPRAGRAFGDMRLPGAPKPPWCARRSRRRRPTRRAAARAACRRTGRRRCRAAGQVQVGDVGGVGAARVGHDDLELWLARPGVLDAPEQHRMRPGRVAANDEQALRVGAGRRSRRAARRRPASALWPATALPCTGASWCRCCWCRAIASLLNVVVLGQQLARDVKPTASGPCAAMVRASRWWPGPGPCPSRWPGVRRRVAAPLQGWSRRVCSGRCGWRCGGLAPCCTGGRSWPVVQVARTPVICGPWLMMTPQPTPQ